MCSSNNTPRNLDLLKATEEQFLLQLFASKLGPMTTNGPFDASVYSIFKRVVNLRLEDSTILSIGSSELFNCPGLIRCHPHHQLDFQHFINHNMSAVCRSELIQIGKSIVIALINILPYHYLLGLKKFLFY